MPPFVFNIWESMSYSHATRDWRLKKPQAFLPCYRKYSQLRQNYLKSTDLYRRISCILIEFTEMKTLEDCQVWVTENKINIVQ
jgi:hypothetical protein